MSARARWVLAGCVVLAAGLGVRAWTDGAVAKYGGVALWATLVYVLLMVWRPRFGMGAAFWACVVISFVVELLQLTPWPRALYDLHPAFALVFGTTFHAWDLPAYVSGALLGVGVHAVIARESS